ncbi:hypothetical protein [Rhizobium lentis]|uniref:Uncharacterized protein n=1 Tax=Rhizobium lentis TaxID=1138194 RepID=A0A9Q3QWY1_9HYPH|nr:hypothetical protein [Rhizobium lentis]MBX4958199.1 hypothetical protein [Rhizobium lentis]MBX4976369.1 hypothetical protein [Rhizobium lentis]MBX4988203.1 hypothetical protein [Rhizobium lentis]MBX4998918.1 hypothetical protein [Rhizobium lentis]MBX5006652.1 hypothetical protein [Rhizobium lentis]
MDTQKSTDLGCLAAALIVQAATYRCAATIWLRVMAKAGYRIRLPDLLSLCTLASVFVAKQN